jgi:hypothetical protein
MESIDYKTEIRALKIIHAAMAVGQILFVGLVSFLVFTKKFETVITTNVFLYVVPIIILPSCMMSYILFKKRLEVAKEEPTPVLKLTDYRSALIVRYALIEGSSLFSIVAFMLTGNFIILALIVLLILYFITLAPGEARVALDLDLTQEEKFKMSID